MHILLPHMSPCVHFQCAPLLISICGCERVSLSACLCRSCLVPLMRGVQGLRGGPRKISFSCFAMKAILPSNRRNSVKWRTARLNYSAFTINFFATAPPPPPPSPPPPPPRTAEPARSSCTVMLTVSRCIELPGSVAT